MEPIQSPRSYSKVKLSKILLHLVAVTFLVGPALAAETKLVEPSRAQPGDIVKVKPECSLTEPNCPQESWSIKTSCPAQWVPLSHGQVWFTGNVQRDGTKGHASTDGTPIYEFTTQFAHGDYGVAERYLHQVCPGNEGDLF